MVAALFAIALLLGSILLLWRSPERILFQPPRLYQEALVSGIAAELAEIHPPRALLLQAPFTSAQAMARIIVWPPITFIWRLLSRIHFDTTAIVSDLDVPVSVAHGKHDRVVPFRMGMQVFKAAKCKGPLLVVEHGAHNDLAQTAGEDYWRWVSESLQPLLAANKAQPA